MRVRAVLTILFVAKEGVAAEELQMMQLHAELSRDKLTAAHSQPGTRCDTLDCDLLRHASIGLAQGDVVKTRGRQGGQQMVAQNPAPIHLSPVEGENYVVWDLCNASFNSNLGGEGPDSGENAIRYFNVGSGVDSNGDTRSLDFVITAITPYAAKTTDLNGLVLRDGEPTCFGQVNVKSNTAVDLHFNWYLAGTSTPIEPSRQFFTVYDLDGTSKSTEEITFYSEVDQTYTSSTSPLKQSGRLDGSGRTFSAEGLTNNVELPVDPEHLSQEQKERAVTVEFTDTSQYKLTFTVTGGRGGRNFAFSGYAQPLAPVPRYVPTPAPTALPRPDRPAPPPAQDAQCVGEDCIIWGDPHIITFQVHQKHLQRNPDREVFYRTHNWKNDQLSVAEQGTFWLVKNDKVQIQGRYVNNGSNVTNATSLKGLAVGGSFLAGNLLLIEPSLGKVMWNDEEILHANPLEFHNDMIHATYNNLTERVTTGKIGAGMQFQLPEGIILTVNRWKYSLDAKISVCHSVAVTSSGQCGKVAPVNGEEQMMAVPSRDDWLMTRRLKREEIIFPDGRPVDQITAKFAPLEGNAQAEQPNVADSRLEKSSKWAKVAMQSHAGGFGP